jgi:hypothetical protein
MIAVTAPQPSSSARLDRPIPAFSIAPPDRYSNWFTSQPDAELDLWIRSPSAPAPGRVGALERWIEPKPNEVVLGRRPAQGSGKYSPVAEYLRARLRDPVYTEAARAGRVWVALARSGWLGEWAAEKSMSGFVRQAAIPVRALPEIAVLASGYVPEAIAHLCGLLHGRAAASPDLAERMSLYAAIHRIGSAP